MRSLISWIMSTEITGDPYTSALCTVISKATSDEEDRNALITSEECEERATSESTSGADAEDLIKALAVTMAGSSAESSGTTDPVSSTVPPSSGGPTAKSRAATAKLAAESAEEESPEEKAPSEDGSPSEETSE